MESTEIPGGVLPNPIPFDIPLQFPEEDLKRYPWLHQRPRYYLLGKRLDPGGYAIPFVGVPCDSTGQPIANAPQVIIKVPNVGVADRFTSGERASRQSYIQAQTISEWKLTRTKLLDCDYGSPIFDLGTAWVGERDPIQLFISAQRYIDNGIPIERWLIQEGLKPKPYVNAQGEIADNWRGLNGPDWTRVASMVAHSLAEIHRRRVVHGDIWPPNIFMVDDNGGTSVISVFIDFGESFVCTPTGDIRSQKDHPYRAPERGAPEYVPTEQVDVYSLGKLMLYLAIGIDITIPRNLVGHHRRAFIRDKLFERNQDLVVDFPYVIDMIARCTAIDPVARPTSRTICDEFEQLSILGFSSRIGSQITQLNNAVRIERVAKAIACVDAGSIFMPFIERQIVQLERLIDSCGTDMIELVGTRDQLIHDLQVLFSSLKTDDSWSALTDASVWHDGALGLDGRYATSTIQAVRRGASVHRVFVLSVEEIGSKFAMAMAQELERIGSEVALRLNKRLRQAIRAFESFAEDEGYVPPPDAFVSRHRERFCDVVDSLHLMIKKWRLKQFVFEQEFSGIREAQGLFIGLIVVPSLSHLRQVRIQHPVSLMCVENGSEKKREWLLVMTDLRDRHERERGVQGRSSLRGIRVYKSVLEVPHDRIIKLNRIIREDAVNIGGSIEEVNNAVVAARDSDPGHSI